MKDMIGPQPPDEVPLALMFPLPEAVSPYNFPSQDPSVSVTNMLRQGLPSGAGGVTATSQGVGGSLAANPFTLGPATISPFASGFLAPKSTFDPIDRYNLTPGLGVSIPIPMNGVNVDVGASGQYRMTNVPGSRGRGDAGVGASVRGTFDSSKLADAILRYMNKKS